MSVGGEIFRTCPDRPWDPTILLYSAYRVFPGGKERPGRDADPLPPSSAVVKERVELYLYSPYGPYSLYRTIPVLTLWAVRPVQSYTCTPPMGRTACTELYLYSPYGPYGLYRAIPVLLLWAVRPVQSLSVCTRVHFTFLCLVTHFEIEMSGTQHGPVVISSQ